MILTLENLPQYVIEEGDCWLWQRGKPNGYPLARIDGVGVVKVTAYIFTSLLGRRRQKGQLIVSKCGNRACVNPSHVGLTTHSAVLSRSYKTGARNVTAEIAVRRKVRRESGGKMLTDEQVGYIRAQPATRTTLSIAKELGFDAKSIAGARKGLTHRTVANGASVFAWRP